MAEAGVRRIIVVPRNGYVNRLQAWASAAILGSELDVPVQVLWEPEVAAPAPAPALVTYPPEATPFIAADAVTALLGMSHDQAPRYLTHVPERAAIVLAGHDRGEQVFMPELARLLDGADPATTLVIIAGGHFHRPGAADPIAARQHFYRALPWSPAIADGIRTAMADRQPFLGLHIRQTDRSREAPSRRTLEEAITSLRETTGIADVFVAADTDAARAHWTARLEQLGMRPWTIAHQDTSRSSVPGAEAAMIDWNVLGHSQALAFTASSSFGHEAAVLGGCVEVSRPLVAEPWRQRSRDVQALAHAAVTLPRRRGSGRS